MLKPLNFDLLSNDAIKALSGVLITQTRIVKFQEEASVCSTQDNQTLMLIWTASWKWSGDREPAKLQNSRAEYHVPSQIR